MNEFFRRLRKTGFFLTNIIGLMLLNNVCAQMNVKTEYYIGFINKTGHNLDEVSAYSTNVLWAFPTPLVAGGQATEGAITVPIPPEAEVRMIDQGEHKAIKVSLKDVPKKGFQDGTIYFVINTNGTVDVKPIKSGDTDAVAKLVRSSRPKGEYRLGFVNKTGHDVAGVAAYYGEDEIGGARDIPTRVKLGYSDSLTRPIPPEADVRWQEGGVSHAVKVNLKGVPQGFEGRIFFVIKADATVEVYPIKNGDDKNAFKVMK